MSKPTILIHPTTAPDVAADGIWRVTSAPGGTGRVAAAPAELAPLGVTVRTGLAWADQLTPGQKVTVLRAHTTWLGGTALAAHEGRWLKPLDGWIPKGGQGSRYIPAQDRDLVLPGWQATALTTHPAITGQPALTELTRADLTQLPRYDDLPGQGDDVDPDQWPSPAIGLVAYGTWTVLGDQVPGAAWLLYAYDPDTDIAEGYLGVPEGPWYSEHGSVYGEQLLANPNMGRVASIPPGLTFATCMQLEHRVLDWLRTGRDPISEPDPDPLLATALDPPDHGPGALRR